MTSDEVGSVPARSLTDSRIGDQHPVALEIESRMKISQAGSGAPANRSRKASNTGDADKADDFKNHVQDEAASAPPAPASALPLTALSNFLAIQETSDQTSERRRAILQGNTLLDELTDLQIGLVQGWVSEETLKRVTHLLDRPRPNIDDQAISQALHDIEVRAAVELAKLEQDVSLGDLKR